MIFGIHDRVQFFHSRDGFIVGTITAVSPLGGNVSVTSDAGKTYGGLPMPRLAPVAEVERFEIGTRVSFYTASNGKVTGTVRGLSLPDQNDIVEYDIVTAAGKTYAAIPAYRLTRVERVAKPALNIGDRVSFTHAEEGNIIGTVAGMSMPDQNGVRGYDVFSGKTYMGIPTSRLTRVERALKVGDRVQYKHPHFGWMLGTVTRVTASGLISIETNGVPKKTYGGIPSHLATLVEPVEEIVPEPVETAFKVGDRVTFTHTNGTQVTGTITDVSMKSFPTITTETGRIYAGISRHRLRLLPSETAQTFPCAKGCGLMLSLRDFEASNLVVTDGKSAHKRCPVPRGKRAARYSKLVYKDTRRISTEEVSLDDLVEYLRESVTEDLRIVTKFLDGRVVVNVRREDGLGNAEKIVFYPIKVLQEPEEQPGADPVEAFRAEAISSIEELLAIAMQTAEDPVASESRRTHARSRARAYNRALIVLRDLTL